MILLIGWTEWKSFNRTRNCNNENFQQVKGLQILIQIKLFKKTS
jgi:hypothetical protein